VKKTNGVDELDQYLMGPIREAVLGRHGIWLPGWLFMRPVRHIPVEAPQDTGMTMVVGVLAGDPIPEMARAVDNGEAMVQGMIGVNPLVWHFGGDPMAGDGAGSALTDLRPDDWTYHRTPAGEDMPRRLWTARRGT
jgi:hypothetical protein